MPDKFHFIKPVDGIWRCCNGPSSLILADFLANFHLLIDQDCQFCRIIRGDVTYEYRAYDALSITITILQT